MLIALYCLALFGAIALLFGLLILCIAFWYEIRITVGKDKGKDGKA